LLYAKLTRRYEGKIAESATERLRTLVARVECNGGHWDVGTGKPMRCFGKTNPAHSRGGTFAEDCSIDTLKVKRRAICAVS
jgi:hypothetical protein